MNVKNFKILKTEKSINFWQFIQKKQDKNTAINDDLQFGLHCSKD